MCFKHLKSGSLHKDSHTRTHTHTHTKDLFSRAIIIFLYRFSCDSFSFCGLFHDSESNLEYTVLNGKITYDHLKIIWYEGVVA